MTPEELNKACEWLKETYPNYANEMQEKAIDWLIEDFRKAMDSHIDTETSKRLFEEMTRENVKQISPIFEKCLTEVNPEVRNEVRSNMDAVVKESLTAVETVTNCNGLTWRDIARIADIIGHTPKLTKEGYTRSPEEFYTEILRRFKEKSK